MFSWDVFGIFLPETFVHGVQQSAANKDTWPNHARGPNEELAEDPSEGEPYYLDGQCQHKLLAYRPLDTVNDAHCSGDISDFATTYYNVGHDGDQSMFFDVEWPGIQGTQVAKGGNAIFRKNPL